MVKTRTFKKILSAVQTIRENAIYHYSDKRFAILHYLYFSVFRINRFLIFENDRIADVPQVRFEPPFRIEIKTDAQELRRICDAHGMPRECYYADILDLHVCLLVCHGEEIALICWLSLPGEYSRFFKLEKATAEIYFTTTLPKFRGMGLPTKTDLFACRYLARKGFRKAVAVIHETNAPSIKTIVRAGFTHTRTVRSIGPFNRKLRI